LLTADDLEISLKKQFKSELHQLCVNIPTIFSKFGNHEQVEELCQCAIQTLKNQQYCNTFESSIDILMVKIAFINLGKLYQEIFEMERF